MTGQIITDSDQESLLVTFRIGKSFYGLDTSCVQEVILVSAISRVYRAPEEVCGIINLRGKIVTVIDLGKKLSDETTQIDEDTRILITPWMDEFVGLLVSGIGDVINLDPYQVEPSPPNVSEQQTRYFVGIYRTNDQAIAVLNLKDLLS